MKKILISLVLVLTLLTAALTGCGMSEEELDLLKADAAAVFTLDVNPGVRVYVDEDNAVIAVEATNEDGEEIASELDLAGEDYETAVEEIVDKMDEKGYLEGDAGSVLVSVEKKEIEVSEKINEKLNKVFKKHGKKVAVIEQDLAELEEDATKALGKIAKKYNISEGKARLVEKIREEYPELSEEELSGLKVSDLGIMLNETSKDVRDAFKKVDEIVEKKYIGKDAALEAALESLEITVEDVTLQRVHATRKNQKMAYEVDFVYDGMEYEIVVDSESGEILETEKEEFEEFDAEGIINDFCDKHNIDRECLKDKLAEGIFGKLDREDKDDIDDDDCEDEACTDESHDHDDDEDDDEDDDDEDDDEKRKPHKENFDKVLSRGELLNKVFEQFEIAKDELKKTDVKIYEAENGAVYSVIVITVEDDKYELVVEAYTGVVIKAELNDEAIEFELELPKIEEKPEERPELKPEDMPEIPEMPEREDAAENDREPAKRPEKDHGFLPEILPEGEATDNAAPEETIAVEETPVAEETAIDAPTAEETEMAETDAELVA